MTLESKSIGCFSFLFLPGSVHFTPDTITWFLPRHMDPLVSSSQFKLSELHVGVDGERLDATEMAARGYALSVDDKYVVLAIPVGAAGGYFKVGGTEYSLIYLSKSSGDIGSYKPDPELERPFQ